MKNAIQISRDDLEMLKTVFGLMLYTAANGNIKYSSVQEAVTAAANVIDETFKIKDDSMNGLPQAAH